MANQLQITGDTKVKSLNGVLTGTSGVVGSVPLGAANGVATLDSGGKVPVSQLPSSVVTYLGIWNAATNTPTLVNGTGDAGDMYICNVAGTVNFGAGPVVFAVGDWVLYGSGTWQKSNGQNGTVTSVGASITGGAIGITGSPITTAGTLAFTFAGTSGQYVNGAGNLTTFPTLITSIGLSMPSAFSVANSPLTANGSINVTGAGTTLQFIDGTGALQTFPSLTGYVPYTGATNDLNLGTHNLYANNIFDGFTNVAASGSQIVLTIASTPSYTITGSGGQTIKLPDATTLPNGAIFSFNNNQSSGAITINNNSNTLVVSVPSGGFAEVVLLDNSIAAGSWDRHFKAPSNVSWSTNTLDYAGSITNATWNGNVVAINRGGTGSSTQNFVDLTTTQTIGGAKTFSSSLTASSLIKTGGTSSQFLKADGSVDSSFYITLASLSFAAGSGAYNSTTGVITIPTNNTQITNGANYITLGSLSAGVGISYNNTTGVITSTITQYTDALARAAISLTTTGTSGAATYNSTTGVLNVPNYAPDLSGYVTLATTQTISGVKTFSGTATYNKSVGLYYGASSSTSGYLTLGSYKFSSSIDRLTINSDAGGVNGLNFYSASSNTYNFPNSTGTIALTSDIPSLTGYVNTSGTPTTNYLPKFTGASTIGNSAITDDGTTVTLVSRALSGTSATFSSSVTANSYIEIVGDLRFNSSGQDRSIYFRGSSGSADGNWKMGNYLTPTGATVVTEAATVIDVYGGGGSTYGFMVRNTLNSPLLQIAGNTGAATFSGKIGVGGASATYSLTAYNSANGTTAAFGGTVYGVRIDNGGTFSSGRSTIYGVDSSFYGSYQPLSIEASSLTLNAATGGNVLIGTTTDNGQKLQVQGNSTVWWNNDVFVGMQYIDGSEYRNGFLFSSDNRSTGIIAKAATGSTPYIWFGTGITPTERMRITSGGNVGIGTSSPEQNLTVAGGSITASGNTGSVRQVLELTTASTVSIVRASYQGAGSYGDLALWTGGSARLTIASTGAATFSSSVTAGGKFEASFSNTNTSFDNSAYLRLVNTGASTLNQRVDLIMRWADGTYNGTGGISMVRESGTARSGKLILQPIGSDGNNLEALTLASTGAATFSSTVEALRYNATSSNASLPAYATSSGAGMFNLGSDVGFSTASTERMRITSGGNVEIASGSIKTGTTSYGAGAIKLGIRNAGTAIGVGGYMAIEIDGSTYFLNLYTTTP